MDHRPTIFDLVVASGVEQDIFSPGDLATLALVSQSTKWAVDQSELRKWRLPLVAAFEKHQRLLLFVLAANRITVKHLFAEFAKAIETPDPALTYHGGPKGKENRGPANDHNGFTITSRTVAFDRFLRLAKPQGIGGGVHYCSREGPDNYFTCLKIDEQTLDSWNGKRVLDIGCGSSFFYAEALAFHITVHPMDVLTERESLDELVAVYAKNTLFLQCLLFLQKGVQPGVLAVPEFSVLATIANNFPSIIDHYRDTGAIKGDLFNLSKTIGTAVYDVTICSYVFCYLDRKQKVDALVEMIAVTKVGGEVRICTGMSGIDSATIGIEESIISDANKSATKFKKCLSLCYTDMRGYLYCFEVKKQ